MTSLVQRYLDDDTTPSPELALGRHHFRPAEAPDVLTLEQAAALAEAGELPGRRIGSDWRFPRAALLEWLAAR